MGGVLQVEGSQAGASTGESSRFLDPEKLCPGLFFFTTLFFEVVEMKACKLWPLPTHRWRWQPTFSEEGGGAALGWRWSMGGVSLGTGFPLILFCGGKSQTLLPFQRPQHEDGPALVA